MQGRFEYFATKLQRVRQQVDFASAAHDQSADKQLEKSFDLLLIPTLPDAISKKTLALISLFFLGCEYMNKEGS